MLTATTIDKTLEALGNYWKTHTHLRLGQIMGNLNISYYTSDEEVVERLCNARSNEKPEVLHQQRKEYLDNMLADYRMLRSRNYGDHSEFTVEIKQPQIVHNLVVYGDGVHCTVRELD